MSSLRLLADSLSYRGSSYWLAVALLLALILLGIGWRRRRPTSDDKTLKGSPFTESDFEGPKDFEWRSAAPRVLRPLKGTYHITMGVQADHVFNLITIDKDYQDRVEKRREIIRDKGSRVHGCLPSGEAATRELYSFLMRDFLPRRYPGIFTLKQDGKVVHNNVTNKEFPSEWSDPDMNGALRALAETVEEDMFLLHETEAGHLSDSFVCCFPAGFDPSQKLGKLLKEIHGPVPSYEKIGPSMERFFSRLEVGKNVKRTNWSMQTHAELTAITGNHITEEDQSLCEKQEVNPEDCFLRVELQTLMRLPETKAILFSFKTYMYSIPDIKAEGSGLQLAEAIEGLKKGNAPGMWVYKGGVRWGESICEYLRS